MRIQCPNCGVELQVRPEHKGKKVKCPKCKQPFPVTRVEESRTPNSALETPAGQKEGECHDVVKRRVWLPPKEVNKGGIAVAILCLVAAMLPFGRLDSSASEERPGVTVVEQEFRGTLKLVSLIGIAVCLTIGSFHSDFDGKRGLALSIGSVILSSAVCLYWFSFARDGVPSGTLEWGRIIGGLPVILIGVWLLQFGFSPKKELGLDI